jgi:Flp pilus assembly secretin CpaC
MGSFAEGKFDNLDESSVIFMNREPNFKQWTLILDNVGAGKLVNHKEVYQNKEMLFVSEVQVIEQQGSFANSNRSQTKGSKNITSAKVIITGSVPIHMSLKETSKKNSSLVSLCFLITDKIPQINLQSAKDNGRLEFTVGDFDDERPVGNFLGQLDADRVSPKVQKYLRQLKEMPIGTFVTVIYNVKYHDIAVLKSQLEQIKSELGKVSTLDSTSKIMIRDRSEYVLEMLQILLAIDTPVPQVVIDVQIVERKTEEGADFSTSFSYLRKNGTGFGGSIGYPDGLKEGNLSGVYSQLSYDLLEVFQANINSEIKRGKARVKATTRLVCKNRQAAQFNSGNSIPYYQLYDTSKDDKNDFYRTHDRKRTKTSSSERDSYGSTNDYNRYEESKSDYRYDQEERKMNRKWKVEFIKTGVNLWLQPNIKNSNLVELALKPSYSEITGLATHTDIPILSDRSIDTALTVKNGDTILVAGLLYEKEMKMVKGVPLLMDIPLLGGLFSKEISMKQQTEIIFVLTLYIQCPKHP